MNASIKLHGREQVQENHVQEENLKKSLNSGKREKLLIITRRLHCYGIGKFLILSWSIIPIALLKCISLECPLSVGIIIDNVPWARIN